MVGGRGLSQLQVGELGSWESDQGWKAQRTDDDDDDDSRRSARRPPHFRIRPAGTGRGGTEEAVKHV